MRTLHQLKIGIFALASHATNVAISTKSEEEKIIFRRESEISNNLRV